MYHVRRPEEPAFVAGAVKTVVADLIAEEEQQPHPPLGAQIEDAETINQAEDAELHRLGHEPDRNATQSHRDARSPVFDLVQVAPHDCVGHGFNGHEHDKRRDGEPDKIRHDARIAAPPNPSTTNLPGLLLPYTWGLSPKVQTVVPSPRLPSLQNPSRHILS